MRQDIPISQRTDAFELESRGIRELFKIEIPDEAGSVMYLTPHDQIDYMDHVWEHLACKLTDHRENSTGEQSRPKFSIANPNGIFSLWAERGQIDGALITRYQVLLPDLQAGVRAYTKRVWVISKIVQLNNQILSTELRSTMDGPSYMVPARCFYPPEFPHVSLR